MLHQARVREKETKRLSKSNFFMTLRDKSPKNNERKSNKERSRRARVRKKQYIEEIEAKCEALEKENALLKD